MKLSEAMMLGDSLRDRVSDRFLTTRGGRMCGCAIGGATLASGRTEYFAHRELWPWLLEESTNFSANYPSKPIRWESWIGIYSPVAFNKVVRGDATFEQLVDYVRSIEPDCGVCNRFECICAKDAEPVADEKAVTA